MTDPATLIAASKAVVDGLKALYDIAKNKKDPALMAAVADLQAKVVEQGTINLELQGEVHRLRGQVEALERAQDIHSRMRFDGEVYWLEPVGPDGKREGPFCQACYDTKKQESVRLLSRDLHIHGLSWLCLPGNHVYERKAGKG